MGILSNDTGRSRRENRYRREAEGAESEYRRAPPIIEGCAEDRRGTRDTAGDSRYPTLFGEPRSDKQPWDPEAPTIRLIVSRLSGSRSVVPSSGLSWLRTAICGYREINLAYVSVFRFAVTESLTLELAYRGASQLRMSREAPLRGIAADSRSTVCIVSYRTVE